MRRRSPARSRSAPAQQPIAIGASLGGIASLLAEGDGRARGQGPLFAAIVLVDITPRVDQSGVAKVQGFMRERAARGLRHDRGGRRCGRRLPAASQAAALARRVAEEPAPASRRALALALGPARAAGRAFVRAGPSRARSRADRGREGDHDPGAAGARRLVRAGAGGACARVPRARAACRLRRRGGGAPHGGGRPQRPFLRRDARFRRQTGR